MCGLSIRVVSSRQQQQQQQVPHARLLGYMLVIDEGITGHIQFNTHQHTAALPINLTRCMLGADS
jgi:hypothetical protein